ncbi:uncharacterized protein At4g06744-like [Cucurbita moschata]|uniref:Uncharacterized protein At4g06744-like n=1 Tax=Cucurbita moschata TaxID=3662 RepID=A0A6J1E9I5_CUCMO|nr:uncharacterized protein At4g06744-like [Cucurbita moschata]
MPTTSVEKRGHFLVVCESKSITIIKVCVHFALINPLYILLNTSPIAIILLPRTLIMHFFLTTVLFLSHCLYVSSTRCPPPLPPPPPPPPPECPPPESPPPPPEPCQCQPILSFLDQRLAVVYPIIQSFKALITSDPFGVTQTWVGSDICKYEGFFCDNPPDNKSALAVAAIDFNGFQLSAPTLDGFIDALPDLAIFHANSNNFSGTITPKIASLPYLYELDLSNNQLSGPFPTAVLGVTDLFFFDIRFNFFTGSVPQQVFVKNFDFLFINNNNFGMRLPTNFGSTTAAYITLANNKFTGPIPRSIGKAAASLTEILFLNNQLTGCIPYEVGFLKTATVFDAGENSLTGPLPSSLGCLEKVEQLNFAGNFLYGQVPEVVCELGNLLNLSLSDNYFTKIGPSCRKLVRSGVLDLRKNCIRELPDQKSPMECFLSCLFRHPCPFPATYGFVPCNKSASILHSSGSGRQRRSSVPIDNGGLSTKKP